MQDALKILIEKLKGVKFVLIGTFNLFIQGIDIVPHDLDILTDDQGVEAISKIFKSVITEEPEDHYKETSFRIGDTEVHVVSDQNNPLRPKDFKYETVWQEKNGLKIPCLSLQSELLFYQKAKREKDREKIHLIREFLRNKSKPPHNLNSHWH